MRITMRNCALLAGVAAVALGLGLTTAYSAGGGYGGPFNFGAAATPADIAAVDIAIMADGRGLPPGKGTYAQGKAVYLSVCVACHGDKLQGVKAAGGASLIGGRGTVGTEKTKATIESYWPYATTVFDYVRRAMPFNAPGSLSDDQVYAVTAYILGEAKIIGEDTVIDATSLPKVRMPNRDGFIPDPRPDVFNYN